MNMSLVLDAAGRCITRLSLRRVITDSGENPTPPIFQERDWWGRGGGWVFLLIVYLIKATPLPHLAHSTTYSF